MLDTCLQTFIHVGQLWPCELVELLSLAFCSAGMVMLWRRFGVPGVVAYQALAIILANIQVLQVAQFTFGPMALGNSLFATTFWCTYLLTTRVSPQSAHDALMVGFWAQVGVMIFMVLSLAHNANLITSDAKLIHQAGNHYQALSSIFTPSLRLVIASLLAYYISQKVTIFLTVASSHSSVSSIGVMVAGNTVDQFVFSLLAWIILSPEPVTWLSLWRVYIIPSLLFRLCASLASPFVLRWMESHSAKATP